MARSEHLPKNVSVREHSIRFHPNDTNAVHGGMLLNTNIVTRSTNVHPKKYSKKIKFQFTIFQHHFLRFALILKFTPTLGVTAFPGEGGEVYGLRNKRLFRQFKTRKEWFEYEDQSFDYDDTSKGLPWDPEIAKKMDRYTDRRFLINKVEQI